MSCVEWIAAAEEISPQGAPFDPAQNRQGGTGDSDFGVRTSELGPQLNNGAPAEGVTTDKESRYQDSWELERARRIYRGRTIAMLKRYMRYSIETGRLPSLLGREFFRAKVTSYTVVTFEDRVIFVHDMERCLEKLDEFSRQLIARHILQEHDQAATGRLLNCAERTVRTWVPMALDLLSQILLDVGLLEDLGGNSRKSCQGGKRAEISVSRCERGKNIF
jgi:hypothetical protein